MSQTIKDLQPAAAPEDLTPMQKRIWDSCERMKLQLLRKNADYGASVFKVPVLAPWITPGDAIRVRISDKLARLTHLMTTDALITEESIHDTVIDTSAYFMLLYVWLSTPREELQ